MCPLLLETHTPAFILTSSNTYEHDEATGEAKNHAQVTSWSSKTMKNERGPGTALVTSWKAMLGLRRGETVQRIPDGAQNEAIGNTYEGRGRAKTGRVAAASTP
ncbi:hypothetical protein E2C01_025532 [Portunus trituberculatus]|uniref:Uncharacterized protein n=1 Tax=Portunus trituberculatus TaxID=210409 RepID=A0A5B7EI66_PORTR|nr:hypothetical protein [Portunus trituberculatus]